jgi:hypothetical protein
MPSRVSADMVPASDPRRPFLAAESPAIATDEYVYPHGVDERPTPPADGGYGQRVERCRRNDREAIAIPRGR